MEWQAWLTLSVVVWVLVLLMTTQRAPDLILAGGMTVLLAFGVLTPEEAIKGFSNEGLITVAALFVVAAGIDRTGGMAWFVDRLMGRPKSLSAAQLRVMVPPAFLSAFMNNTPLVAMMMPVIADWAKKNRLSVSKLLLPMNNAVVLGGLCTLIGTSTTVVVSGLLASKVQAMGDSAGVLAEFRRGLGMFDITWLGVPVAIIGISYMIVASRYLLRDRKPVVGNIDDPRSYTVEMMVLAGSPLVGRTIEEAGLRHLPNMYLMEIDREGQVLQAVAPTERLAANDRLVFVGVVESVKDLQRIRGLAPATDQVFKLDSPREQRRLIEAVVSNTCPLIGKTIRAGRFRSQYNAAVIAVGRNGERINKKIGDIVLRAGDTLLLEAHPSFVDQQRNSRDFYLVTEVQDSQPPLHHKAPLASVLLLGMIVAASTEALSMLTAAFVTAAIMVVTRCVTSAEARRSIDLQVLLVIASSFGIARAMEKTGVAGTIASSVIGMAADNPWLALTMVYLVTMAFTELMSNNAAAVLVFPIAWATAGTLQVNPMPFVMAVAVGASVGLATPFGYQTNLMVYGPGGYRVIDYVRFGGPLNLIVGAIVVTLAPVIWPFR